MDFFMTFSRLAFSTLAGLLMLFMSKEIKSVVSALEHKSNKYLQKIISLILGSSYHADFGSVVLNLIHFILISNLML